METVVVLGADKFIDLFSHAFVRHVGLQVGREGAAAHVLDDLLGGVESALLLVVLQEALEDAAEHFWVYAHLRVVRVVLVDGEVVLFEEGEEIAEQLGGEAGVGAGFEASVGIVLLKESAVEVGHAHLLSEDARVVEVIVGLAVGIERVEEEMLKHFMDKVGLLLCSGFLEELVHESELALAPAAAIGHAHPAFLLQEVEEDDAPEQLLHVVAHTLLVAAESLHDGLVGRVLRAFLPLIGLLAVVLAGGVKYKIVVVCVILLEELL